MTSAATDRTVHASSQTVEVVRYDRGGKWFLEPPDGRKGKREQITIQTAVEIAVKIKRSGKGDVFLGRPGGQRFDSMFRKLTAS